MNEHRLYRVTDFQIMGDFTLRIHFDDGSEQIIDFEPALFGPVFEPLRNPHLFNQVRLVPYAGCLEWPTGADFDPETLHNWPEYKDEIIQRGKLRAAA
jgi:tRNA U34 5-methylaminomethyl-2-thiouridine-forming methyltransferase MnmC